MAYIPAHNVGDYYFLAGDLNMPKSQETGFQNLLNPSTSSIRFNDPENQPGNWNNNYTFRNLHTQSTRDGATNSGCFSGVAWTTALTTSCSTTTWPMVPGK